MLAKLRTQLRGMGICKKPKEKFGITCVYSIDNPFSSSLAQYQRLPTALERGYVVYTRLGRTCRKGVLVLWRKHNETALYLLYEIGFGNGIEIACQQKRLRASLGLGKNKSGRCHAVLIGKRQI